MPLDMRTRSRCLLAAVAGALSACTLLASCGSRTPLFVIEQVAVDAAPPPMDSRALDSQGLPDTTFDAGFDVTDDFSFDTSFDATPDVDFGDTFVPPIDGSTPDASIACADGGGVTQAYLWAASGLLYTFDPPTLTATPLGMVQCPSTSSPWTLSVSRAGFGYMIYEDWNIYKVDLSTLECTTTPYVPFQLGFTGEEAIAVSRGSATERLFVYGVDSTQTPTLAVTDLTSFVLSPVGLVTPDPMAFPLDMQGDAFGRLFALSDTGQLLDLASGSAALLGEDQTAFDGTGGWAIMTWNDELYFFGGTQGTIYHYDLTTKQLSTVGQVNDIIVGASAAACIH
jgi:hypothetical protein